MRVIEEELATLGDKNSPFRSSRCRSEADEREARSRENCPANIEGECYEERRPSLGRMCRNMIRPDGAPTLRAASTKVISLT